MMFDTKITRAEGERGNALFLILIAVALFAALSYAITQSGRGGGSVTSQTVLITAGQVVEQPAAVRAAVTRMMVTGDTAQSISFVGDATCNTSGTTLPLCVDDVFDTVHGGGGATNLAPPVEACNSSADCTAGWVYVTATTGNGTFVEGVGTSGTATNANGGSAFAVLQGGTTGGTNGVTSTVCTQIQKGLGFTVTTPPTGLLGPVGWSATGADAGAYAPGGSTTTVSSGSGTSADALWGQDFACFRNTTADLYAYYAVLIDQ